MDREPIIFIVSDDPNGDTQALEKALRERYSEGYSVITADIKGEPTRVLRTYRVDGDQIAVFVVEQHTNEISVPSYLNASKVLFPDARKVLFAASPDVTVLNSAMLDHHVQASWSPADKNLYPILDELLAEWRASVDMPFIYVRGIMTVRAVRIHVGDSLHRAAEMIALSGVGDLMVVDKDNNFVGVLSVGDVLRAAMPDMDEIMHEGGSLEQAFRLFLRKGSELMYKPIDPLIINNPLVVEPDDHVAKVAALMLEKNIHRLPVVKDGRLVGTVGRADICQAVVGTL
jgi:CBS domain-containing protein